MLARYNSSSSQPHHQLTMQVIRQLPGAGAGGGGICDLPADCVARIASLTSPGDACRLAAAAAALRPAVDSDDVWGRFLPPDWADILERRGSSDNTAAAADGPSPVEPASASRREREMSKKELFFRLCDSPVLLDGGKLCFSLERRTGAKKYLIPARALCFGWSGFPYGGLVWLQNHPDSRFSEVAVLSHLCWLDIYGFFNVKHLSNDTSYAAYLVYKVQLLHLQDQSVCSQDQAAWSSSSSTSSICSHECNHLVPHKHLRSPLWDLKKCGGSGCSPLTTTTEEESCSTKTKEEVKHGGGGGCVVFRGDGWMEQEIISKELMRVMIMGREGGGDGDDGEETEVSIEFRGLTGSHQCQIIVEGIEIRPTGLW